MNEKKRKSLQVALLMLFDFSMDVCSCKDNLFCSIYSVFSKRYFPISLKCTEKIFILVYIILLVTLKIFDEPDTNVNVSKKITRKLKTLPMDWQKKI